MIVLPLLNPVYQVDNNYLASEGVVELLYIMFPYRVCVWLFSFHYNGWTPL